MNSTAQGKEQPVGGVVELVPGIEVREHVRRQYGFRQAGGGTWKVTLDSSSGTPALTKFELVFESPVPIADLLGVELPEAGCPLTDVYRFAQHAIGDEAQAMLMKRTGAVTTSQGAEFWNLPDLPDDQVLEQAVYDDTRSRVLDEVTNSGGRPRVDDSRKLEILEAFLQGGIAAAMEVSGVQERQTRKHISAARKLRVS